jgi:hypothetical protein
MPVKSPGRQPEKSKLDLKVRGKSDPQRRLLLLYLVAMALGLWFWQDAVNWFGVRTISYSEFKRFVANREVVECAIKEEEITGRIVPTL